MTIPEKRRARKLRNEDGLSYAQIGKALGFSSKTIERNLKGMGALPGMPAPRGGGSVPAYNKAAAEEWVATNPEPTEVRRSEAAIRALEDFVFFFTEFIGPELRDWDGEVAPYWREMADAITVETIDEQTYLLINIAPGHAKTTCLLAYVIWRICKDRNIKIVWMSASEKLAKRALRFIVWHFEHNTKLIAAFGRFRPFGDETDVWSKTEITVVGADAASKEATVSVYGAGQAILGVRVPLIIADDVVDTKNSKTPDQREQMAEWWHSDVETRLEPGGVLACVGSRLSPHDLYGELAEIEDPDGLRKLYVRVKFPAHDASKCPGDGTHGAYPEGCTLWPSRWPYKALMRKRAQQRTKFDLVFQQEDVAADEALVPRVWLTGGTDPLTGWEAPGCFDAPRAMWEVPDLTDESGNPLPGVSVVTVDPSGERHWSIQWWLVEPDGTWWLVGVIRQPMGTDDILDCVEGVYSGHLEDIWSASCEIGYRLRAVIFENNAAQRWWARQRMTREWEQAREVAVWEHSTGQNKADPNMGVWGLRARFQFGKVRLPGAAATNPEDDNAMEVYVSELTTWPNARTTDCVMATWFLLAMEDHVLGLITDDDYEPHWRDEMPDAVTAIPERLQVVA